MPNSKIMLSAALFLYSNLAQTSRAKHFLATTSIYALLYRSFIDHSTYAQIEIARISIRKRTFKLPSDIFHDQLNDSVKRCSVPPPPPLVPQFVRSGRESSTALARSLGKGG